MAEETRKTREKMDETLIDIVKDWEGFEDVVTDYYKMIGNRKSE